MRLDEMRKPSKFAIMKSQILHWVFGLFKISTILKHLNWGDRELRDGYMSVVDGGESYGDYIDVEEGDIIYMFSINPKEK